MIAIVFAFNHITICHRRKQLIEYSPSTTNKDEVANELTIDEFLEKMKNTTIISSTTSKVKWKRITKQKLTPKPVPPVQEKVSRHRTDSENKEESKSKSQKRGNAKKNKPVEKTIIFPCAISHE